jgi:hypothetical protein
MLRVKPEKFTRRDFIPAVFTRVGEVETADVDFRTPHLGIKQHER